MRERLNGHNRCKLPGGEIVIGTPLNRVLPPYREDMVPLRDREPYCSVTYGTEGLELVEWDESGNKLSTTTIDKYPPKLESPEEKSALS